MSLALAYQMVAADNGYRVEDVKPTLQRVAAVVADSALGRLQNRLAPRSSGAETRPPDHLRTSSVPIKPAAVEVARRDGEKKETLKVKRPRPELPVGLSWPESDYGTWLEAQGEGGDIVTYLEREWLKILDAGRRDGRIYADRRIIADWYPSVITAIKNYQKTNKRTGTKREIPEHLRFPTERQVNDHLLSGGVKQAIEKDPRMRFIVVGRLKAGIDVPGL